MADNTSHYYSITFVKTIWVERDDTDDDQKGKNWGDLDEETKDIIIDKALDEINSGDFPIETSDLSCAEDADSNMNIDELNA